MGGRTYRTEAVVLRSFRLGEADCVLHLYTLDRGRVGAVAKGLRRTRSRVGARLEPLSHVNLHLHQGRGELQTVSGVDLIRSHRHAREHPYRLGVALVGAEAMLRLFTEQEANARAFAALLRFLELTESIEAPPEEARPALDPLALAFQLKLLWLAGWQPHLDTCAECGAAAPLVAYVARAGGAVCQGCTAGAVPLSPGGLAALGGLLRRPLADAHRLGISERDARETLRVLTASYEEHGGFRLRTATA
jgi:DNA repair protein RecO (recombination protein O)